MIFGMQVAGNHYVGFHRQVAKQTDVLEGTGNAQLCCLVRLHIRDILSHKSNLSAICMINTGDGIKDGRFSGSVGTDEPVSHAFFNFQAELINSADTAEMLFYILHFQNYFTHFPLPPFFFLPGLVMYPMTRFRLNSR